MKRRVITIAGILSVTGILAWSQIGVAQMGRGGFGYRGGSSADISPELAAIIEMTDAQQEKRQALQTAFAKEIAIMRADAEVAGIELREVMDEPNPNASDARSKATRVSEIRANIFEREILHRVEMKNVLTPAQHLKLEEARKLMQGRRSQMRGRRGNR